MSSSSSSTAPESSGEKESSAAGRALPQLSSRSQIFAISERTSTVAAAKQPSRVGTIVGARSQRLALLIGLVVLFAFFTILEPQAFLSEINMRALAETAVPILIAAVAVTFILASGEIDLSVGSVMVLSGVAAQTYWDTVGGRDAGGGAIFIGVVIALVTGVICGFLNGIITVKLKIPSLITTLGMMGIALGASQLITGGQDKTNVPSVLTEFVRERPLGIPVTVFIAVGIAVIGGIVLKHTRFGLRTVGIGSDETMLRRRGIGVDGTKIRLFTMAGLLYGIAGLLVLGRYSTTAISGQSETPLLVITAVVIGGTSLFGGSATMIGTAIGVLIPALLYDGLIIIGVESFWEEIVTGIVLIVAVFFDQVQRRRRGT